MLSTQLINIAAGILLLSVPILSQDNAGFPAFPAFPEGSPGQSVKCSGSNCKISSSSSSNGSPSGSQSSFDPNEARRRIQEGMNPNGNFGGQSVRPVGNGDGGVPRVVAPSGDGNSRGNQDGPIRVAAAASPLSTTFLLSLTTFVFAICYNYC